MNEKQGAIPVLIRKNKKTGLEQEFQHWRVLVALQKKGELRFKRFTADVTNRPEDEGILLHTGYIHFETIHNHYVASHFDAFFLCWEIERRRLATRDQLLNGVPPEIRPELNAYLSRRALLRAGRRARYLLERE